MKVRKLLRYLAPMALLVGLVGGGLPAHAGTSGWITNPPGHVINFLKHAQNSFRPDQLSPYSSYQYACQDAASPISNCGPMDIAGSSISTDTTGIHMTMQVRGAMPQEGDAITAIPAPFVNLTYEFAFATTAQDNRQQIGINCVNPDPDQNTGTPANTTDLTEGTGTGVKIVASGIKDHGFCQQAASADAENHGIGNGHYIPVERVDPVYNTPHPASDGWLAVAEVQAAAAPDGAKRADGNGLLHCKNGQPVCIDYDMQVGDYEGYSGFSETQDQKSFTDQTRPFMNFSISSNGVTINVPNNPTVLVPNGNKLIDDERSFPWIFKTSSTDKVTNFVPEVTGVAEAGVNTVSQIGAVCTDDSGNIVPESAEPIHSVGAAVGDANYTVAGATSSGSQNPAPQQVKDVEKQAFGKDGLFLIGTGSRDEGQCTRGIYGLVTVLNWLRNGFELRVFPRSPAYAPSTDSVSCRYPIGHFPAPPAPVTVEEAGIGPTSAPSVDVNTSPYDSPYKVEVYANGSDVQDVQGVPLPNPNQHVGPLDGQIGVNKKCNYTYVTYGLHYLNGNVTPFTM